MFLDATAMGCPSYTNSSRTLLQDECADYNEWTKMTEVEKFKRLSKHCVDDNGDKNLDVYEAKANVHGVAEMLVDAHVGNGDGKMQCEEFNKAYFEVKAAELCTLVTSTPHSELNIPNNGGLPCSATMLLNISMTVLAAAWFLN